MQTNIDQFFKTRKRPATDELPGFSAKLVARKLFDSDPVNDCKSTPSFAEARKNSSIEAEKEKRTNDSEKSHESEEQSTEGESPSTPVQSPSTQDFLRKKLDIGEFKKIVRHSKKYTTLKSKLDKFNATNVKLQSIQESLKEISTPELKKFNNVEIEVPSSPVKCGNLKPRRLFWTSPYKSPVKNDVYVSPKKLLDEGPSKTPVKACFEKYNRLLAGGKESLILPHKYLVLKEVFRAMDIVTKVKNTRGRITFNELQKEIQKMLRRNFTKEHLGKVRAIYPESYDCAQECIRDNFSGAEKYELIVKRLSHTTLNDKSEQVKLTNTDRLKIFHDRLLQRAKTHHQDFLKNLDPPVIVDIEKLRMWHPEFQLDEVPDVESAPIPQPPNSQENLFSAKSILTKTHNMISINRRMERAVSAMSDNKEKSTSEISVKANTPTTPNPLPAFQKALQGIPKSILEKIRAKQAVKMAETLTQTPAEAKEAIMLSRLPELARIMRNVFVNEKKGILPVEVVMLKIGHSYKEKLGHNELLQHMKLISKHVPGWMNFCIVRNVNYIRLSKDADMTRVLGKLQNLANPA